MAPQDQSVIYRYDPAYTPAWQFHGMPESIVGGGADLDEAKSEYKAALEFSIDSDALPAIDEYVEMQIGDTGIWLRSPIDLGDFDENLAGAARQIDPDDHEWFFENATAAGDPVILNTWPNVPLSRIFRQMSTHDTLILAMRYHGGPRVQNLFVAFAGHDSESGSHRPVTGLEDIGLTADSPLSDLLGAALKQHVATTIRAPAFC